MSLQNIINARNLSSLQASTRAPGWDRSSRRLLVGRIRSFVVTNDDEGTRINAEMICHDNTVITLFHTAYLGYAFCNLAKVQWSDRLESSDFDNIEGWCFVIHYKGQDETNRDAHTYDIFAGPNAHLDATDDGTLEALYSLVASDMSSEDLGPIAQDGEDSDL